MLRSTELNTLDVINIISVTSCVASWGGATPRCIHLLGNATVTHLYSWRPVPERWTSYHPIQCSINFWKWEHDKDTEKNKLIPTLDSVFISNFNESVLPSLDFHAGRTLCLSVCAKNINYMSKKVKSKCQKMHFLCPWGGAEGETRDLLKPMKRCASRW